MLIRLFCSVFIALIPVLLTAREPLPTLESEATALSFTSGPVFSNWQTAGFTVHWATNFPSSATLRYGLSPALGEVWTAPAPSTSFTVPITGLDAGTIYWVQIEAVYNGEAVFSAIMPCATVSESSGQIKVYFNHDIEESMLGDAQPYGLDYDACRNEIIGRIDAAQQTIDVAMYNNNRTDLTNALKQAHARGVRVRYIAAEATNNSALNPAPAFPVLYGNDEALMHNKFMVVDADLPDAAWVMGGSMNWTFNNMNDDYNNLLFIQDQSLAKAYVLEFEEMWGGNGPSPVYANSRFGSAKQDNTPHTFIIGGILVESWFSPSDGVTDKIVETIQSAQEQVDFALYTFTHNDAGDALIDAHNAGVNERGFIENISDPGCEYNYMLANGVDVLPHPDPALFHHKYVVADAFWPNSDPRVLTGSHNWSYTAESANDENTLVIHDADIARLFAAEFQRRWSENTTPVSQTSNPVSVSASPNPVLDRLLVEIDNPESIDRWQINDMTGRVWIRGDVLIRQIGTEQLPSGAYTLVLYGDHGLLTFPFQKI